MELGQIGEVNLETDEDEVRIQDKGSADGELDDVVTLARLEGSHGSLDLAGSRESIEQGES